MDTVCHGGFTERDTSKKIFVEIAVLLEEIDKNLTEGLDISNYLRKLKQLKRFGPEQFLRRNNEGEELSSLISSLRTSSSNSETLVRSLAESTVSTIQNETTARNQSAEATEQNWAQMQVLQQTLLCHQYFFVSNKGKKAGLTSFMQRSKTTENKNLTVKKFIGKRFKMESTALAEGSLRIAYRGLFNGIQTEEWFRSHPDVVVKKMKDGSHPDPNLIMKLRHFAACLSEEFNLLLRKLNVPLDKEHNITLLDLLYLPGMHMTMEPYIDHKSYKKWYLSDLNFAYSYKSFFTKVEQ